MKYLVVTGVSTGIGYGTTKALIEKGYHVFGSVRKQEDADRLSAEFGTHFTPLLFDVRDEAAIAQAVAQVEQVVGSNGLAGLINNAGMAMTGPLMLQPMEEFREHFEVNVFGLLAVTRAFLPLLGASKEATHAPGRIINISSVAGKVCLPLTGAYSASKHAVEGLSHSLRRELMLYGIDLIIIGPGVVESEIWEKQKAKGFARYDESDYAPALASFGPMFEQMSKDAHTADEFGLLILKAFEAKRPKVRHALVASYIRDWVVLRSMPARMLDRMITGKLKMGRKAG